MKEKLKSNVKQIQVICDYLINECKHDNHLAERIMLENKTLDGMYKYIIATVRKNYEIVNNGVCVAPEDVYNMAIHYFIEDNEVLDKEVPNVTKAEINTNKSDQMIKDKKPKGEKKPKPESTEQFSLFDLDDESDTDNEYDEDDEYEEDDD